MSTIVAFPRPSVGEDSTAVKTLFVQLMDFLPWSGSAILSVKRYRLRQARRAATLSVDTDNETVHVDA